MAVPSRPQLSPLDASIYTTIHNAQPPPRRFWSHVFRLVADYALLLPSLLVATPLIITRNLFPFLRRHRGWSFSTGVYVTFIRVLVACNTITGYAPAPHSETGWLQSTSRGTSGFAAFVQKLAFRSHGHAIWGSAENAPLRPHLHGRRLDEVWISPAPADWLRGLLTLRDPTKPLQEQRVTSPLYRGPPRIDPGFAKRNIKCYWYLSSSRSIPPMPEDAQKRRTTPVVLYCHGGAGIAFGAGDSFMGDMMATNLSTLGDVDVFSVDYDLAPYAKYPAAISQLFAAWLYLTIDLGYRPDQIFLGGDSFGGFSTLVLERYLRDVWPVLEPPSSTSFLAADPTRSAAWVEERVAKFTAFLDSLPRGQAPPRAGLILFSPWLHTQENENRFPLRSMALRTWDLIPKSFVNAGTRLLEIDPIHLAYLGQSVTSPWISPFFLPREELAALPPVWMGVGGAECFLEEGNDFEQRAREAGADIEINISAPNKVHDFYLLITELDEAKKHFALLNSWIKRHSRPAPLPSKPNGLPAKSKVLLKEPNGLPAQPVSLAPELVV